MHKRIEVTGEQLKKAAARKRATPVYVETSKPQQHKNMQRSLSK
jgi:hypothetical protein